jgi:hypothetical protein
VVQSAGTRRNIWWGTDELDRAPPLPSLATAAVS